MSGGQSDACQSMRSERPRERLARYGVRSLADDELLALWLGSGTRDRPVQTLARCLLEDCGDIGRLTKADLVDLDQLPGVGSARAAQFIAIVEICRRVAYRTLEYGSVLSSPADVREFLALELAATEHEVFAALFLDNRHRVIAFERLFVGTIDGAAVYPREVVKRCLSVNAAAVIFAHNHPSGVAEPSDADVAITGKLRDALALIDVRMLDHLIVGRGVQTSMAERGLI